MDNLELISFNVNVLGRKVKILAIIDLINTPRQFVCYKKLLVNQRVNKNEKMSYQMEHAFSFKKHKILFPWFGTCACYTIGYVTFLFHFYSNDS